MRETARVGAGSPATSSASNGTVPFMTTAEAAAFLRRRPPSLRLLVRRGEISFYRVGRAILFDVADLRAYLARVYRPARTGRGRAVAAIETPRDRQ